MAYHGFSSDEIHGKVIADLREYLECNGVSCACLDSEKTRPLWETIRIACEAAAFQTNCKLAEYWRTSIKANADLGILTLSQGDKINSLQGEIETLRQANEKLTSDLDKAGKARDDAYRLLEQGRCRGD